MKPLSRSFVVFWLAVHPMSALIGCGGSGTSPSEPKEASSVTRVPTGDLPELGEFLPPLDDGRVEVAGPADWSPAPRSNTFVARFQKAPGAKYPTIIITAEDSDKVLKVNESNVEKFAEHVAVEEGVSNVRPLVIGRFVGVAYRKKGKVSGSMSQILDRLLLDTVVDGRKYTLELRAREGGLEDAQDDLFAVAGGMKFPQAEAEAAEAAPGEDAEMVSESESEQPAQKQPEEQAEEKPAEGGVEESGRQAEQQPAEQEQELPEKQMEEKPEKGPKRDAESSEEPTEKVDLDKELEGIEGLFD